MSDDLFSTPSSLPQGSSLKVADIEGSLVVVRPEDDEVTITSEYGETTARPAKVLVVSGPEASGEWLEMLLFGAGLKAQAGAAVRSGKPIVGVIGKGVAQKGKSAPWLFIDPSATQLEAARKAYAASTVPF